MPRWIGDNSEVLPEPTSHSPRAKRWIPVQPKRGVWENGKAAFNSDPSGKIINGNLEGQKYAGVIAVANSSRGGPSSDSTTTSVERTPEEGLDMHSQAAARLSRVNLDLGIRPPGEISPFEKASLFLEGGNKSLSWYWWAFDFEATESRWIYVIQALNFLRMKQLHVVYEGLDASSTSASFGLSLRALITLKAAIMGRNGGTLAIPLTITWNIVQHSRGIRECITSGRFFGLTRRSLEKVGYGTGREKEGESSRATVHTTTVLPICILPNAPRGMSRRMEYLSNPVTIVAIRVLRTGYFPPEMTVSHSKESRGSNSIQTSPSSEGLASRRTSVSSCPEPHSPPGGHIHTVGYSRLGVVLESRVGHSITELEPVQNPLRVLGTDPTVLTERVDFEGLQRRYSSFCLSYCHQAVQ
ncbi:hypothetical protein FA13DRAFT_1710555 [Coprinellus micaceus]|uniref:Uncharacterized protein n=1 Tax=Coprinellus micaceus TaxID=71717 RepID=A0A4Y7T7K6_COPMI|nr:hypothetical protein FA13DRAFT_1710555 [Coprinellus micaceus]